MNVIGVKKKFITISQLKNMGYSYYKIGKFEEAGIISRINRSTYENLTYKGEENDFVNALAYVPKGIICLMSAARYYDLTNYIPDVVEVAIERKKKVNTLPDWPKIRIYYFDSSRMSLGVSEIYDGLNHFRIFDKEKTVVDVIYYRNKIGIEETSEILKNYLKRDDRDVDKLYNYAKCLRCEKVLRTYLEVLL